jgi:glycine cleavage system pyridoxal-binding protein P
MDSLIRSVVPGSVSYEEPLSVAGLSSNGQGENETLQELKKIAKKNRYEIKV